MKRAVVLTFVVLAFAVWWTHDTAWDVVSITPSVLSPLNDGLKCSSFEHRNGVRQVICYRSEDRWWGEAVVPAYYAQDGGPVVPLF